MTSQAANRRMFSLAERLEQHRYMAERIRAAGFTPVEVPHPLRPDETIYVAAEIANDDGQECPVCGDFGYVKLSVAPDDPRFGQLILCTAHCRAAADLRHDHDLRLFSAAKLPDEHRNCTLESFGMAVRQRRELRAGKQLGYYAAEAFIHAMDLPNDRRFEVDFAAIAAKAGQAGYTDVRKSLIFSGPYGVGKTGLAAAIVNAAVGRGIAVRYVRTMSFLNGVQSRYRDDWADTPLDDDFGDVQAGNIVDLVKKVPLLVLDDFDLPNLKRDSDKAAIMEEVIRYRHGWHLPTVITTNLANLDAIEERWGATTVTVLGQMAHWIPMAGEPMRPTPQVTR